MAKTNWRKRRTRLRINIGRGVELLEPTVLVGFLLKRENAIFSIEWSLLIDAVVREEESSSAYGII